MPSTLTFAGLVFDAASGVLFALLGLAIALVRPWRPLKTFFGLYALGLGTLVVLQNVPHLLLPDEAGRTPLDELTAQLRVLGSIGGFVASLALVAIGWRVSRRRGDARTYALAFGTLALLAGAGLLPQLDAPWEPYPRLTTLGALVVAAGTYVLVRAASIAALLAIALAAWKASREAPQEVSRLAFLSLGIAPFAAFASGDALAYRLSTGVADAAAFAVLCVAALFAVALAWATIAARVPQGRWPTALAWSVPALVAAGVASFLLDPSGNTGAAGVVRTASVIVLAYATLRHDLFGRTRALQGGLRGGTIAMAFAAAFLVGGRLGETFLEPPYDLIVSMASMAALFVALDPLRRAADRLAASAAEATSTPAHASPQAPPPPPAPGVVLLGRYRVEERLGEGGQGAAYLCRDGLLDRKVVAKAIPLHGGGARHLEEARRLAKIRHPHVVQVFDVGQDGAHGYVLMEHVAGGSLRSRLARGRLSGQELAQLGDGVLGALDECHRHGIVHGDVKPENVLIEPDGTPKLADFGSARPSAARAGATARAEPAEGTLPFLAPEQVRGGPATPASDVHAAGVLLALAAAGAHPLARRGLDDFEVRHAILAAAPALDGVPDALVPVLRRALEKDPAGRWPSAAAMREAWVAALREKAPRDAAAGGSA